MHGRESNSRPLDHKSHPLTNGPVSVRSLRYVTSHPGQLSLAIPPWVGAMSSSLQDMGGGLVWLIEVVVCLHAAPQVQLFATMDDGWLHNALRYH